MIELELDYEEYLIAFSWYKVKSITDSKYNCEQTRSVEAVCHTLIFVFHMVKPGYRVCVCVLRLLSSSDCCHLVIVVI